MDTNVAAWPALDLPAPTSDIEVAKAVLDRLGVAILRGVISQAETKALRARLEEQADLEREQGVAMFADPRLEGELDPPVYHSRGARLGRPLIDPPFQFIGYLPNKGREFIDLATNPKLLELGQHVLREPFRLATLNGIVLRKGALEQTLHADQAMVPFPTPKAILCNFMVALGPFNANNGGTRFAPGTHHLPPPHMVGGNGAATLPLELEPGDIAVFDSRVWHGQGACTSDETRYSVVVNYAVSWWRAYENYNACLHEDVLTTLSKQERELLGLNHHLSFGHISPRTPEDRSYITTLRLPYIPELRRNGSKRAVPVGAIQEW